MQMNKCKIDDCNNVACTRGYCEYHYHKLYRQSLIPCRRRNKKVALLDYDSGEILKVYPSITVAAKQNYINRNKISKAITNQDGYVHLYHLRFKQLEV